MLHPDAAALLRDDRQDAGAGDAATVYSVRETKATTDFESSVRSEAPKRADSATSMPWAFRSRLPSPPIKPNAQGIG